MDYFNILGTNIRALRLKKNYTQEHLAEICDLHRTYVGAVERGDRNVSLKNIVIIANALDTTPADLLSINEEIRKTYYERKN